MLQLGSKPEGVPRTLYSRLCAGDWTGVLALSECSSVGTRGAANPGCAVAVQEQSNSSPGSMTCIEGVCRLEDGTGS